MYKIVFIDMDGTLLKDNKSISNENKRVIEAATEKGIKIVVCTGRPIDGIKHYLSDLNLITNDQYSVTCTGADVQNNTEGKIIFQSPFNSKDLEYLYNMAENLDLDLCFYNNGTYSVYRNNLYGKLESIANNTKYEITEFKNLIKRNNILKVNLINENSDVLEHYVHHFGFDMSPYSNFKFRDTYNKNLLLGDSLPQYFYENFSVLKTCTYTFEVLSKNTNKGTGVKELCQYLDIPTNEVICIGDSPNDLDMLKCAGLPVAMGNASDEIKHAAKYITLTNEENGVANVLEKFVL